jgi:hypothetical protein
MDVDAIVSYLLYRTWRSSVFFNVAVILFGALLAKIATNFASGEPGLAGCRVSTMLKAMS